MKYKINEEHCLAEEYFPKIEDMHGEIYDFPYDDVIHDDLDLIDGKYVINEERYWTPRNLRKEIDLRFRRNHLLTGWDKYASNVAFGVYVVSQSDKEMMMAWYHGLLDLKEDAINNPPSIIKYLIGEKPLENDIFVGLILLNKGGRD